MPNLECICCKESIEKHLAVICNVCKHHYKYSCAGLSQAEVRSINLKSKHISWNCNNCNALGNDLNSLKAVIISLQNDLREIKSNSVKNLSSNIEFEDVMQEFEERQKRKSNVIIFGVSEQNSDLDKKARLQEEKQAVTEFFNEISPNELTETVSIFRLGKYNATSRKPRPIRVRLANEQSVHDLIHKFAAVRNKNRNLKDISISFDRTPKQLEHLKKLKIELAERQKAGEMNLNIKFIRGYPKIITSN